MFRPINKIYNEYFTTAYVQTLNSANICKIFVRKLSKIFSNNRYSCESTQLDSIYSRNGLNTYVCKFTYDLEIKSIQRNMVEYFLHMLKICILMMSCLKSSVDDSDI